MSQGRPEDKRETQRLEQLKDQATSCHTWATSVNGRRCIRCDLEIDDRPGTTGERKRNPWMVAWFAVSVAFTVLWMVGARDLAPPTWMLIVILAFQAGRWEGRRR